MCTKRHAIGGVWMSAATVASLSFRICPASRTLQATAWLTHPTTVRRRSCGNVHCMSAFKGPPLGSGLDSSTTPAEHTSTSPACPPNRRLWDRLKVPKPPPDDPVKDSCVVERLNDLFYDAVNKRETGLLTQLWMDADDVLYSPGNGNVTRGYSEIIDYFRRLRHEERRLDPGHKGLKLEPTFRISDTRVVIHGMHAWITCKESLTRGLLPDMDPPEPCQATNIFRKFNGQWRIMTHWSSRLACIPEQLEKYMQARSSRSKNAVRGPGLSLKDLKRLGLPPGLLSEDDDDDDDDITLEIEEILEEGDSDDEEDVDAEIIATVGEELEVEVEALEAAEELAALEAWLRMNQLHRGAVFRKRTKRALVAVRKLWKEGHITNAEKVRLIHSVIHSTSQEEVSQVEMAYDVLITKNPPSGGPVSPMEEFADQCKVFLAKTDATT